MEVNCTKKRYEHLCQRDIDLIEKLQLNAKGKYPRFTDGDTEYLISIITKRIIEEGK